MMRKDDGLGGARFGLVRIAAFARRSEFLAFLPAATLAAFWFGGEAALMAVALGIPFLFALLGSVRVTPSLPGPSAGIGRGLRGDLIAHLDRALDDGADNGLTTACLVVQFDDAAEFLDRHGRAVQTEVLSRCSERLAAVLRPGDSVARLEGGGFAVALAPVRRLDLEMMVQVAARLQAAMAPPYSVGAARLYLSASVGFCLAAQRPEGDGRTLLDAAQVAADDALRNGPGAIRAFAPAMARHRADREAQRDMLDMALAAGQIRAHFQPQVSTDTGAVTGFEALARWHHPDRGLLPPSEFLPLIEEAGLASRLGEVILHDALSALARWDRAGAAVPRVAVNFSAAELRDPRLAERLGWELDRFDIAPARLSVEILETVAAEADNDVLARNVAQLAALGCAIDLDDFGTGHSGITNLRRLAVRRLKIDRSFVRAVDDDREQQRLVAAILAMAERLGLDTLAEGVETAGEHAMLAQLGCAHVQGFAIGRPMPVEDTLDWIAAWHARAATTPRITQRAR